MILSELLQEAFSAVTVNKVRSGLTTLGIVIGIGSVIALIAVGQGAQGSITASIQSIGSNLVLVMPGAPRGVGTQVSAGRGTAQSLTQADSDAIASTVPMITAVAPETTRSYQVTAVGTNTRVSIVGTTPAYLQVRNVQLDTGSFITDENVLSRSRIAVLGPTVRNDLFGAGSDPTGQAIRINNIDFKVAGITVAKGGTGFGSQDNQIYVPISAAQQFLAGNTYVTTISVEAQDQQSMAAVQQQITSLLLERHKISDPTQADFQVLNQQDLASAASSITGTFTILLAAIAGISLIVGGIGIMNMMLTTVTERTREIGLRKAIGAKRLDISVQFLIESVMLTFLGGVIGVILGWLLSVLVTTFAGIATSISLWSVLLAFGVSAAIGMIFGYYPARRAAGLNPIEALRYE